MLISCPECNKQVSDKAPSCPHCGVPFLEGPTSIDKDHCNPPRSQGNEVSVTFPILRIYLIFLTPLAGFIALGEMYGPYASLRDQLGPANPVVENFKLFQIVMNLFNLGMCIYANIAGRALAKPTQEAIEKAIGYFHFYLFYKLLIVNTLGLVLNNMVLSIGNNEAILAKLIGLSLKSIIIYALAKRALSNAK